MFSIHDERNAAAEAESIIQNLSISAVPSIAGSTRECVGAPYQRSPNQGPAGMP
jgi:hypothetical protein